MFFRNLVMFAFPINFPGLLPTPVADELGDLQARLAEAHLKPVGPQELASQGFISPYGRGDESLVRELGAMRWVSVGQQERILPAAVVNDLLERKLNEIEEREGRMPSGRSRKRLRDDLVQELIPQAFVKPSRTDAYLDLDRGLIAVDTSSRRAGDQVISQLRRALGSFPAVPLNAEVAPRSVLTGWLAGEALPDGFSLGDECELRDAADGGAVVRIQNSGLQDEEVAAHLAAGLQCTRLALRYHDRLAFVFGEDLVVRKLRFLDGVVDQLENSEQDDSRAELDARFALMSGELGLLFDALVVPFKLTPPEGGQPPAPAASASAPAEKGGLGEADPLYEEAVLHVRESQRASISNVQRVLKIGYSRASWLIEAMESRGVVTPPQADGYRKVL